jgi:hypothetical protein
MGRLRHVVDLDLAPGAFSRQVHQGVDDRLSLVGGSFCHGIL